MASSLLTEQGADGRRDELATRSGLTATPATARRSNASWRIGLHETMTPRAGQSGVVIAAAKDWY
ncbi:MAG: hypothetical protein CMJ70_27255 [Planctomycetaceae bacterium]|nr:hypothetical protein [Planctomycetaceae bacterium]|tara:strand:- start:6128 stop:6322 length:195 start_codon:yes stop_codon:yes gene_type:complete